MYLVVRCDLSSTAFSAAKLTKTTLEQVNLTGAELFRTALTGMDLTTCTLDGITLSESCAELKGATIHASQAAVVARILGIEVIP